MMDRRGSSCRTETRLFYEGMVREGESGEGGLRSVLGEGVARRALPVRISGKRCEATITGSKERHTKFKH